MLNTLCDCVVMFVPRDNNFHTIEIHTRSSKLSIVRCLMCFKLSIVRCWMCFKLQHEATTPSYLCLLLGMCSWAPLHCNVEVLKLTCRVQNMLLLHVVTLVFLTCLLYAWRTVWSRDQDHTVHLETCPSSFIGTSSLTIRSIVFACLVSSCRPSFINIRRCRHV